MCVSRYVEHDFRTSKEYMKVFFGRAIPLNHFFCNGDSQSNGGVIPQNTFFCNNYIPSDNIYQTPPSSILDF